MPRRLENVMAAPGNERPSHEDDRSIVENRREFADRVEQHNVTVAAQLGAAHKPESAPPQDILHRVEALFMARSNDQMQI